MSEVILSSVVAMGESLCSQWLHNTGNEEGRRDEELRQNWSFFWRQNCIALPSPPWASFQVSDFGLSKRMEQSTQMQCIKRSALQGTLSYTLPPPIEMFLESNKGPGPKYDVYR